MDWEFAGFLLWVGVLVIAVVFSEHQKNKLVHPERMAAIEKGLPPASLTELPMRVYLRRGLLWLIPGMSLAAFLYLVSGDFNTTWGVAGVLMMAVGTAYLLYYFAAARTASRSSNG